MESPLKRIEADLKTAMLAKDAFRLSVLRMLKSALKNQEIEFQREVTEVEFLETLTKLVKQRQDSVSQFEKAGRTEMAQSEQNEITILQAYLPKALTESELQSLIDAAIQDLKATGPSDMGKVMNALKDATRGKVDGKVLSEKVSVLLRSLGASQNKA